MNTWSLPQILAALHDSIELRLSVARQSLHHPGTKGNASEQVWLELLKTYLPHRYKASSAHIVDSNGSFSDQIDIVVFDRQYSPFIFSFEQQTIIPAESVYAIFEAKQAINANEVAYAHKKMRSVRSLYRTSIPIPHAGGIYPAKPLSAILGGLLTLDSDWSPPLGNSLKEALLETDANGRLDLGCVAFHGTFPCDSAGCYHLAPQEKAATAFLFELIGRLQAIATVPMIDIHAYSKWLR